MLRSLAGLRPRLGAPGVGLLGLGIVGLGLLPVAAATSAEISPHRASYTLSLGGSKTSSGVVDLDGAMYIEWQEVCDGWTINQRMRFQLTDSDGERTDNDINFSSWEAKDGLSYRFTLRSLRDGEVDETLRGRAVLDGKGKGGKAIFAEPEGLEIDLPPGTLFPTEHTLTLIRLAEKGENQVARMVFDGATRDGALEVNAIIGAKTPETGAPPRIAAAVGARPAWHVRMAFFKTDDRNGEPEYETGLRLQDNGVGRDYTFEYPEFAIKSKLDLLEALPKPKC
jgi:EipB-like